MRIANPPERVRPRTGKALEDTAPYTKHPVGPDAPNVVAVQQAAAARRDVPHESAGDGPAQAGRDPRRHGVVDAEPTGDDRARQRCFRTRDAANRTLIMKFGRPKPDRPNTRVDQWLRLRPTNQRMLIDGKLVDGEAGTFANINPATEDVLGEVADASKADMHRAIDAARRSFDETDWSTNHQLRKRCLEQLHDAHRSEQEELREELIREVGAPRAVTHGPQLDAPLRGRPQVPGQADRDLPVGNRSRRHGRLGHRRQHHPEGVARTGRGGRRHHAVELPVRGHHQQAGAGAGGRQHRGAQARARHPVQRHAARPAHRRAHRHPRRRGQRRAPRRTTSSARNSRCRRRST